MVVLPCHNMLILMLCYVNVMLCYDMLCCVVLRCIVLRCGAVRCVVVQCGVVWCDVVCRRHYSQMAMAGMHTMQTGGLCV